MPVVRVPAALSARTGGQLKVEAEGETVGQALHDVCRRYPELGVLFGDDGQLRHGFLVGVNMNDELASLSDAVEPGDLIVVVAAVAGGRPAG